MHIRCLICIGTLMVNWLTCNWTCRNAKCLIESWSNFGPSTFLYTWNLYGNDSCIYYITNKRSGSDDDISKSLQLQSEIRLLSFWSQPTATHSFGMRCQHINFHRRTRKPREGKNASVQSEPPWKITFSFVGCSWNLLLLFSGDLFPNPTKRLVLGGGALGTTIDKWA